jgi:hypothetical protein
MAQSVVAARPRPAALSRPQARWADDLLVSLLGAWAVLGTVLDSWAHFSRRPDSFFTPWHAVLYSGTFAMVGWTSWVAWRRRVPGGGRRALLPAGYGLGLVGFATFLAGAAGDLTWHTVLGIETNLDGALSPTHLTLILAGFLLFTTPLRSAWALPGSAPGMRAFLPALLALLNVTVLLAMTTSWAAAWVERTPTLAIRQPAQAGTVDGYITVHGVVSVLVSNLVMLGPVLLALRR